MSRHRLAITTLGLLGFGACTFGAEDFQIVPSEEGSAATGNSSGASNPNAGEGSGAEATGGSAANEGGDGPTTTGGAPVGDAGAGGAGQMTPNFLCNPQAATFTIFTAEELGNRDIQDHALLASAGETVVVMVPTEPTAENGVVSGRLYYRAVTESQGGNVDTVAFYDISPDYFRIGGGRFVGADLKVSVSTRDGVTELTVPTTQNGRQFGVPSTADAQLPDECTPGGGINGTVRDFVANYDENGTRGYAVTCETQNQTFSLHIDSPTVSGEIAPLAIEEINNIARQYYKLGDTHVLTVGAEVGPRIGLRMGQTLAELQTVHEMSLNNDSAVYSSFNLYPHTDGLFVYGAAFTAEPEPPPIVPADLYAGWVASTDLADLLISGADGNVPAAPLQHVGTYTKASELVGVDALTALGQNVLGAGATFSPRDTIKATVLSKQGDVLAAPTTIYQTMNGNSIDDHSVLVARLGIGVVVVWYEDGQVLGRMITCLQD